MKLWIWYLTKLTNILQIKLKNFTIFDKKLYQITEEEAKVIYKNYKDELYYEDLIDFITSGQSEIILCSKGISGAIEEMKNLVGVNFLNNTIEQSGNT